MRVLISSFMVLALVPTTGSAQGAPSEAIPVSAVRFAPETQVQTKSGPTIESAAVGIRPAVSADATTGAQRARRRSGVGHDVALMIVGGAAMVAGSVMDGDAGTIFLVGGAIVALWGLYNFLQ